MKADHKRKMFSFSFKGTINFIISFVKRNLYILIVIFLLVCQRVYALKQYGFMFTLDSDDLSYIKAGITFAETGAITMHGFLSAQIMPGMPVFIGLFVKIFGEGNLLWIALKIAWLLMGSATALAVYHCVILYAPKWCGIIASLGLFSSSFVYMDNLILTETPFTLLLSMMVYFTLQMGRKRQWKYFWGCTITYMLALMLKANIAVYPGFVLIYLLLIKYDKKLLMKQIITLACALLVFIIPWSIRNYIHFHDFIPLTYGAGNPVLLGTYQGDGYPSDESLDYETNVIAVLHKKYAYHYNENGEAKSSDIAKYLNLQRDQIMADYRRAVWRENDPISYYKSYFYLKPQIMLDNVYYNNEDIIFNQTVQDINNYRKAEWRCCLLALLAAFIIKKRRTVLFFLSFLYMGNILIYAQTYAYARYSDPLMILRFIIFGIGLYLFLDLLQYLLKNAEIYTKQHFPVSKQQYK